MTMFNAFEYFSGIYADNNIEKIYKASGISQMEGLLADLKAKYESCLVVRDSGDGHLNFRDRRLDTGWHTIYVMVKGKFNSPDDNLTAKRNAMQLGIGLFELMKLDSEYEEQAAYGFDDSKIDYAEIGPIGQNYYGYSFSFLMEHEF